MAKRKTIYACQACGQTYAKWQGRCSACDEWGQIEETVAEKKRPAGIGLGIQTPVLLHEVKSSDHERTTTTIKEFDRVLGGGMVDGALVLIGGDPGVGKSTLMLQASAHLSAAGKTVLYVSGEESLHQTKMRFDRLGMKADSLWIISETDLDSIESHVAKMKPSFLVIDSVQTLSCAEVPSAPGSVTQLRQSTHRLMQLAKGRGIGTFLVGHVTKEGAIAGPRVLEHMVDTVLYLEGNRGQSLRVLRAVKNRFGSTDELGTFQMQGEGLIQVENPSAFFLAERDAKSAGSTVFASHEGSRPLLVEIQALVINSSYGSPRRTALGVDQQRLALLIAVLDKKSGLELGGCDVFLNVAGGLRLEEPATDLAVLAALVSSHLERPICSETVVFGEVGLSGEVRAVEGAKNRVMEASQLGLKRVVMPKNNLQNLKVPKGTELVGVEHVNELLDVLF
jgi:DNA repair protein RadA/Sms